VRVALLAGADPCRPIQGKRPVEWLLEEYTRSDRLPGCLRLLTERGAMMPDPAIAPVLFDDAGAVEAAFRLDPTWLTHRTTLVSAFGSLVDVGLLHIAAEYGHFHAAQALIKLGAHVNATAGTDAYGYNGHTPLFHTVNSNGNRSAGIMRILLDAGADTTIRLKGLHWGQGYPWETLFFDVTPVSFAQMGLLPQVHRSERDIYANIQDLIRARGESMPPVLNVPNKYLSSK
ncbi:MAG TPA: ankyrin repeat domain-containing protein, partial [Pirellulaceae bacterium]